MGAKLGRKSELLESEYLVEFISDRHIPPNKSNFWKCFLGYEQNSSGCSQNVDADSALMSICQRFINHNLTSGNFGSLISVFREKSQHLLSFSDTLSPTLVREVSNALFIITLIVKYLIANKSEFELLHHFEYVSISDATNEVNMQMIEKEVEPRSQSKFEQFFEVLVDILNIPVKDLSYFLHVQAVNIIIILFSVHQSSPACKSSEIYKVVYAFGNANVLSTTLLHFIVSLHQSPYYTSIATGSGSIVVGFAESLLSYLNFRGTPHMLSTSLSKNVIQQFKERYPLSNQSLLLLLILLNHNTKNDNPYRKSIFNCCGPLNPNDIQSKLNITCSTIFDTFCQIVVYDHATLLLYFLMHRNLNFNRFVTLNSNLEYLMVPVLKILYNTPEATSYHIYMTLIVILILSEDDDFNNNIHQIILKNVVWFTERTISEISLGGLIILVMIRTIQYNMLKIRDKYLHTNCLAALANMSSRFRQLHPYVAQRLISLLETLSKKHTKLIVQIKDSECVNTSKASEDILQDLNIVEDVLKMLLEIINACLYNQLIHCPNLIYTLLYKRQVFERLRGHQIFQDVIQNIEMVVGFFSSRLQRVQEQNDELDVDEVFQVISKSATQWSSDRLRKFPDLKFKYVEEAESEEFFVPYVWSLVSKYDVMNVWSHVKE